MTRSAAIVTTMRGAGATIASFVAYHRHLGFDHIYLFADDPAEDAVAIARALPGVTVVPHDEALRRRWAETRFFRRRYARRALGLMDRQQLNVVVAGEMATAAGVGWLLHIDHDELFYAPEFFGPERQSVGDLFERLDGRGVHTVNCLNHEVLVDRAEVMDPFRELRLFKVNPWLAAMPAAAPHPPERQFFGYGNGKSAARLSPDLVPDGVHDFFLPEMQGPWAVAARRLSRNRLTRRLAARSPLVARWSARLLRRQRRRYLQAGNPAILHYLNSGFAAFMTKYRGFDYYAAAGSHRSLDRLNRFHAEAARVVHEGSLDEARAFYEARVVVRDPAVIEGLIAAGHVRRIEEPARVLEALG